MTDREILWEAQGVIGKYWKKEQPPEQARLLGFARDVLDFISATGQRYRFHDYRQHLASSCSRTGVAPSPTTGALLRRTEDFFLKRLEEAPAPEEAELLQVIVDALQFIAATGQEACLDDYIQHLDAGAPPYVVAAFNSEAEAAAWLENHPNPPDFAHVIIASEYRAIHHERQRDIRHLPNDKAIEYYLAELSKEDPPAAVAAFSTREEADAWLNAQPNPARRAWVLVSGEFYLAAYYPNINHRALFPLAMAAGHDVEG